VNELYKELFGHPKFAHWVPYNDVAAIMKSAYGIVPLVTNSSDNNSSTWIDPALKLSVSLRYLALRQGMGIPYTPVKTKEEKALFTSLIKDALRNSLSMTASSTFEEMELAWKAFAKGNNNIYGKYAEHLAMHYKKWPKTQICRDAVKATGQMLLLMLWSTHPQMESVLVS
jgi:hypothetical protein